MSGIKILNASYGAGLKTVDVTGAVSSHIKDGELNLTVTADSLGVTDPAPGLPKQLTVTYTINNGNKNTSTTSDNGVVLISAPAERKADGLQILKADYGFSGNFTDVTDAIQSLVANGSINVKISPANMGIPDPNPAKQKSLEVEYSINGAKNTSSIKDGGYFKLSAPAEEQSDGKTPSQHVMSIGWILYKSVGYFVAMFLYVLSVYASYDIGRSVGFPMPMGAIAVVLPYFAFWGLPFLVFARRLIYSNDLVIASIL